MLTISKILKNGKSRIKITFDYDEDIKDKIKKIPSAKFSKSLRAWHIEYSKEAFSQLKSLGIEIKYISDSGTIGFIRPTSDNTGIDSTRFIHRYFYYEFKLPAIKGNA